MIQDPSTMLVPWGKHRGRTVAELLALDPSYVAWLVSRSGVALNHPDFHAALVCRGAAPDDSPAHNAIQHRFLDPRFQAAFIVIAVPHHELLAIDVQPPVKTSASFEQRGIDVVLRWHHQQTFLIEIKPCLGDDYPTVMRQMQRLQATYLLVDVYDGQLPLKDVRRMFAANGCKIVMLADVEAEIATVKNQPKP